MNKFLLLCVLLCASQSIHKPKTYHLDEPEYTIDLGTGPDVKTQGYGSRIADSLKSFVVGLVLLCLTPCFLALNEYRHVIRVKVIAACKAGCVEVPDPRKPDQRIYPKAVMCFKPPVSRDDPNQLVHFSGPLTSKGQMIRDTLFPDLTVFNCSRLYRNVKIYQWVETKEEEEEESFGGSKTTVTTYSVKQQWVSQKQPEPDNYNRQNGTSFSNYSPAWQELKLRNHGGSMSQRMCIPAATVGEFAVHDSFLMKSPTHGFVGDSRPVQPPDHSGLASFHRDGNMYTSQQGMLKVGDVQVTWTTDFHDGAEVSIIAEDPSFVVSESTALLSRGEPDHEKRHLRKHSVFGVGIIACCSNDSYLGDFWALEYGNHSARKMFRNASDDESKRTWIVRLVGYILLVVAFGLIFEPIVTLLTVVPFFATIARFGIFFMSIILGCACCWTSIGVAWLAFRPTFVILLCGAMWAAIYISSIPEEE